MTRRETVLSVGRPTAAATERQAPHQNNIIFEMRGSRQGAAASAHMEMVSRQQIRLICQAGDPDGGGGRAFLDLAFAQFRNS